MINKRQTLIKYIAQNFIYSQNIQKFSTMKNQKKEDNKYDLVMIGGGCSSFGFLLNAYRNDKLNDIAGVNGICILEKTARFGGGTLEENLIPSNTHTIGALRYLMKQKEADMLPSHFESYLKEGIEQNQKRPIFDKKKVYDAIMPCFEEMKETQAFQKILDRAELTSSLQMLGYFLRMSGNCFLKYAYENQLNIDFKPYQECTQIIEKNENSDFYEIQSKNVETNEITTIQAKKLLMATGGQQSYHPMYDFIDQEKRLLSHQFFKEDGFLKAIQCIQDNPDADISIIGGSHSGFSVIYMLLYGPRFYITNEFGHNNEFVKKRYEKCPICQQIGFGCKCFGDLTPLELPQPILNYQCKIKKHQIKLYHRHNFRLSYFNKQLALDEGYTDFDENCIHKQEGCINSYTGLRGLTNDGKSP